MQLEQAAEQRARRLGRQRAALGERDGVGDVGQREVVGEPRRRSQLVRVGRLDELVGRAAREPPARAEIAAVSHARPVYAGPRRAPGRGGILPRMHSSYALSSDDFAVERDGEAGSLSDLWPGGYQPGDRLGVVLNQPMDPCGCSNLICGTNTLFYDVLRDTKGTGGFFRYADTYLIGVGCEPGDFNQLDVWPMHKFVGVLQPTAEAVLETINDRRITLLVLPESGPALPRRGRALDLECAACTGSLRRHLLARGPVARAAATSGCSATRSSRATSSRRSSRRPASAPASRPACAACAAPSTASRCAATRSTARSRTPPRRARCWA